MNDTLHANLGGAPAGAPPSPPIKRDAAANENREKVIKALTLVSYALVPASVLNYLGQLFFPLQFATLYLTRLDLAAFTITLLLLLLLKVPWTSVRSFLPQLPYLILILVLLLPLLKGANLWPITDPVKWSRDLIGSLPKRCPPQNNSYATDSCILQQLETFKPTFQPRLVDDLRIGDTLISDPRMMNVLDRYYGIKKDFLGGGLSLPDAAGDRYFLSRIPEYWIENLPDSAETVWTWIIEHPDNTLMSQSLQEFLENTAPQTARTKTFAQSVQEDTANLALNSDAPVLIRFAQFAGDYSGYLGLKDAKLVFANNYGEIQKLGLTLSEAASFSGRSIKHHSPHDKVYVWVIFPTSNRDVIPATWHNLLSYISEHPSGP
jgi:hypothetical protein